MLLQESRLSSVITVVGLGPSGYSQLSTGAYRVIRSAPVLFVRTARHPVLDELAAEGIRFQSMDAIYESAETFDEVYERIAERILCEGASLGEVVYAVPGHPLVGERSVGILISKAKARGIEVRVVGSASFIEASLEALGVGFTEGLKIIDAMSMDTVSSASDVGTLIYQVYDRTIASEVKLMLLELYDAEFGVTVIIGAGTEQQTVQTVPLYMLDRCECDHLTTVYIPPLNASPTDE